MPQTNIDTVETLPIKVISSNEQKIFIDLVDEILAITKDDDYLQDPTKKARVKEYEKQIDQQVYKLYGLTEEEIKVVEEQTSDRVAIKPILESKLPIGLTERLTTS